MLQQLTLAYSPRAPWQRVQKSLCRRPDSVARDIWHGDGGVADEGQESPHDGAKTKGSVHRSQSGGHIQANISLLAAKSQSQRETTSNAYILTSILPSQYRRPEIIAPSKVYSSEGEAAYTALYSIIIAIITLSGGELSDPRLRRHLTRLNATENMPSNNPNNPESPSEKTELVLQRMIKQGYLVKVVENKTHGDDDEGTTWHVGPRGKVEVNADAIAGFVRTVYGGGNEELDKRLHASLGVNKSTQAQDEEEPEAENRNNGDPGPSRRRSRRQAAEEEEEQEDEDEEMSD